MKKISKFWQLVIDSDGTTPYRYRIAAHFSMVGVLAQYLEAVPNEAMSESEFKKAFKVTVKEELLDEIVTAIATGNFGTRRQGKMSFDELSAALPYYTSDGKTVTNVTANNEFYSWLCVNAEGKRIEKPALLNGVAFVRFADFIWHLFWDNEFQKWCRRLIAL